MMKIMAFRDPAYLAWIKTLQCKHCGEPADDAHHIQIEGAGGMGLASPDFTAAPLCRKDHTLVTKAPHDYPQAKWMVQTQAHAFAIGILVSFAPKIRK